MTDNDLSREIIDAAAEVHKQLGRGLLESAYKECLAHELQLRKLRVERQKPVPLVYKRAKLECSYRVDMLVEGRIVVELKSVEALTAVHEATVLTYLRLSGHKVGLLINFNVPVLEHGVLRFIMSEIKETAEKAESGLKLAADA